MQRDASYSTTISQLQAPSLRALRCWHWIPGNHLFPLQVDFMFSSAHADTQRDWNAGEGRRDFVFLAGLLDSNTTAPALTLHCPPSEDPAAAAGW